MLNRSDVKIRHEGGENTSRQTTVNLIGELLTIRYYY